MVTILTTPECGKRNEEQAYEITHTPTRALLRINCARGLRVYGSVWDENDRRLASQCGGAQSPEGPPVMTKFSYDAASFKVMSRRVDNIPPATRLSLDYRHALPRFLKRAGVQAGIGC